VDMLISLYGK